MIRLKTHSRNPGQWSRMFTENKNEVSEFYTDCLVISTAKPVIAESKKELKVKEESKKKNASLNLSTEEITIMVSDIIIKIMTNLDSILRRRDITLPTKVRLVKAMVFLVVMHGP